MSHKNIADLNRLNDSHIRILVDFSDYTSRNENRILIPFSYYQHYGLMNKSGEIVVEPNFDRILDSCREPSDVVRVGILYNTNGSSSNFLTKWGLVNSNGDSLLEPKYKAIGVSDDKKRLTLLHMDGQFEVITIDGNTIVSKGAYSHIDSFTRGYARVNQRNGINRRWGIIDSNGNIVLPLKFDNIWNFSNTTRDWTTIEVTDEHDIKRVGKFNLITREVQF